MKTEQFTWTESEGWRPAFPGSLGEAAQLVFLFGCTSILRDRSKVDQVAKAYPKAKIFGCSSAGDIIDTHVLSNSLGVTAICMDRTQVAGACVRVRDTEDSFEAGGRLAQSLSTDGLVHAFVLCSRNMSASELVHGITAHLPHGVSVTGGMAADDTDLRDGFVIYDGMVESDAATILGFYGDSLSVGYASLGGWEPFGPDRLVTKSAGNVLYEFDGRSALALYKEYLGEHANGLPDAALFFPLSIRLGDCETRVVRAILSIDEAEQSLVVAGNVPVGSCVRLMRGNFDRLIDGALGAAKISGKAVAPGLPDLALVVSCYARKLVLKQRVEEEVEIVREVFGADTALTGFYSLGEIAPCRPGADCAFHNQTMTITTFRENL